MSPDGPVDISHKNVKKGSFSHSCNKLFIGPLDVMIYVFSYTLSRLDAEKRMMIDWRADNAWRLFIVTHI